MSRLGVLNKLQTKNGETVLNAESFIIENLPTIAGLDRVYQNVRFVTSGNRSTLHQKLKSRFFSQFKSLAADTQNIVISTDKSEKPVKKSTQYIYLSPEDYYKWKSRFSHFLQNEARIRLADFIDELRLERRDVVHSKDEKDSAIRLDAQLKYSQLIRETSC